jgi:hypothetical protein
MSHYLALTCSALARSIYAIAAESPATVSVQLLHQGLHNTPKVLRKQLQAQIDAVPAGDYDAILMVYGICGTSTLGLVARDMPIVLPRAHDCITLYLGSGQRYQEEFAIEPGTYWYSRDYLERSDSDSGLGAFSLEAKDSLYNEYVEKYGIDNARYLLEVMGEWAKHYHRAVFIDTGTGDGERYEKVAQEQAEKHNWSFKRVQGNRRLLEMMLRGDWPDDEFLTVPPGHVIRQTSDDRLITAVPADG